MKATRNRTLGLTAVWLASIAAAFYAGGHFRKPDAVGPGEGARAAGQTGIVPGSGAGSASASSAESRLAPSSLADAGAASQRSGAGQPLSPGERLKALLETDDEVAMMRGFLDLLADLDDPGDFSALADVMIEDFNPRERGREFSMLMQRWAEVDPVGALEHTKEIDDWAGRWAASTVLSKYVATNRDAAIDWARDHGMPEKGREEDGNWMMAGVISGLAKLDPEAAAELARAEPRSRARGQMLDALLDAHLDRGEEAARIWATSLPDDVFKVGALGRLTARLADKDLQSTVQWVESLPTGEATPQVYSELVERWAREDPNEAGTWLGQLPLSPETDQPRQTFAWRIRERDPESAMAWAATISDPARRDRATFDLARDWIRREPELAKPWVAGSPLPDAVKQRLIGG